MAELKEETKLSGLLPLHIGSVSLTEVSLGRMFLLLPFLGQRENLSARLQARCGVSLPKPNQTSVKGEKRLIWFGRSSYLLTGADVANDVTDIAAVTEQTDAWSSVELAGASVEDVLARLVPVDLRKKAFGHNATIRSVVGHMNASISRTGEDRFLIMVFRSMAETLVEELKEAMEAVAARG